MVALQVGVIVPVTSVLVLSTPLVPKSTIVVVNRHTLETVAEAVNAACVALVDPIVAQLLLLVWE